jgi:cytochrome P450
MMGRIVVEVIQARRDGAAPEAPDLLGLMLRAAHPDTAAAWTRSTSRQQVITFMIAGHETTSGALSFALYYLT